nr:MAG: maturation protein [Leviviridae sp.]
MRTGPFTKTTYLMIPPGVKRADYAYQWWYRNGKDRKTPSPYLVKRSRCTGKIDPTLSIDAPNSKAAYMAEVGHGPTDLTANNRAYAKFAQSVRDTASLGATLAEWGQASRMIALRAGQLLAAARALRRGRFGDFAAQFQAGSIRRPVNARGVRGGAKTFANHWLEAHFGWEPLIKDIGDAITVLQGRAPSALSRGRGSCEYYDSARRGVNDWSFDLHLTSRVQYQARVRVSNPNLALATQMGFINPASVAWELIPFSFVVDWFIPVGNFLNSFTDFVGFEISEPQKTLTRRAWSKEWYKNPPPYPLSPNGANSAYYANRSLGVPKVQLGMTSLRGLSIPRGASAIALLVQLLQEEEGNRTRIRLRG